jgi:hypothetical protein
MDLRTLMAKIGPDIMLDEVGKGIVAPCRGSKNLRLSSQLPEGTERQNSRR